MRHRARVPELCVYQAALLVNGISNSAPAADLLSAPQTRGISPTISIWADLGAFADNETARRALRVVFGMKLGWRMLRVRGAHASKWRHDDPVPQLQFAHANRDEQRLI